jgi:hypothetical protein
MDNKEKIQFLKEELREQQSIMKALELLLGKYTNAGIIYEDKVEPEQKSNIVPSEFSQDLTIPKKILFALKNIKKGRSLDVANELTRLDNSFTLEKALSNARDHLSEMGRNKIINVRKAPTGKGNLYSIKD